MIEIIGGHCSHSGNVGVELGPEPSQKVVWCPHCGALSIASPVIAQKIAKHLEATGMVFETDLAGAMRFHPRAGEFGKLAPGFGKHKA